MMINVPINVLKHTPGGFLKNATTEFIDSASTPKARIKLVSNGIKFTSESTTILDQYPDYVIRRITYRNKDAGIVMALLGEAIEALVEYGYTDYITACYHLRHYPDN